MNNLIENIIALEWDEFQKVNNEGGRTSCQNDWKTFQIMRRSQFLAWNEEMQESYHSDLVTTINNGRNLLTEKYARMMESTAPEKYQALKDKLPLITEEKKKLIERITQISIKWQEEFAREYPNISEQGRPIHADEDGPFTTSIETYERGELSTYSEKTLKLYNKFITQLLEENKNLSKIVVENTVREYGFASLDQAEKKIANT
ncbi:DUF4125 family protein [Acetobacterium carbinolicum]|uniref:DUF4125 family protein n=1 Tax=Acetobacterium carbinolicum TaxID=52690 RepID=UPI0039BF8B0A